MGYFAGVRGRGEFCLDFFEVFEDLGALEMRSVGIWVRERDLGMFDGEAVFVVKVVVLEI